jgi:heme/copper-type cytochrome/quinol oxidase subunit 4
MIMSDDEEGGLGIYLILFGIFVVINIVLYLTTGWVIIPIKK